jgi:adenylate cyclase
MFSLRIQEPGGKLFVHRLNKTETSIGRDQNNDLTLNDPRISRRHALICMAEDGVIVRDLKSGNGTFINNQRITETKLNREDQIRIGDCRLTFFIEETSPIEPLSSEELQEVVQRAPDEMLLKSASGELSYPLKNTEDLRHVLEKKEKVLALFYELSREIGSVFSLDEIYDKVFDILLQVTPASRIFIFRRNEQGEMQQVAARNRDNAEIGDPLPISKTIFAKVARERVSILLQNTQSTTQSLASQSMLLGQIHSVMAAPINGRLGLLGIVYVDRNDILQTFSSDDLDLLNAVTVQLGIALDMVNTHERLHNEARTRENYERFLPQQVVDEILRSPENVKLGGVRQIVTALFADVRGFTTLSEVSSPETVVSLLNQYFTLVSEIIFKHGGTLDKYIGDGLMALFGAPYVTKRDALKAVRAAVDMQRALVEFNEDLSEMKLPPIAVGIGINTGPAIVGYIGSETRLDYTAIGDAINTAARLESNAKPGQIIISETTMQALDDRFTLNQLPPVKLKGKSENLQIAEVLWHKSSPLR